MEKNKTGMGESSRFCRVIKGDQLGIQWGVLLADIKEVVWVWVLCVEKYFRQKQQLL